MKKLLMILALLGLVFLSGCTGGKGGSSSNDGILISSFVADPSVVQGNEPIWLLMDIQNTGGETAHIHEARIIGLPSEWGSNFNPIVTPSDLYPPEQGFEGEITTLEWELTAPESQTNIDYPAEGMIRYGYGTHIETLVRLANRPWLRELSYEQRQEESGKQGTISGGTQNGPIHATIKTTSSTGSRLVLDIQNVGSGFAENDEVTITYSGMSCNGLSSGGTANLIRGKSRQFRCDPQGGPTPTEQWKNIRIDIDLSYTYIVRTPITLSVEGTLT